MEKSVTIDMLKSINIDKVIKEIAKHMSEKFKSESISEKSEKSEKKMKRIPEFNVNETLTSEHYYLTSESSLSYSSSLSSF